MSLRMFTEDEIAELRSNPNVKYVTSKSIQFAEQFKVSAVEQFQHGVSLRKIFTEGGFNVRRIGNRRLRNAIGNWLTKQKKGKNVVSDKRGRPVEKSLTMEELLEKQRLEIQILKQENDFLRQIRRLERRYQPYKSPSDKNSK